MARVEQHLKPNRSELIKDFQDFWVRQHRDLVELALRDPLPRLKVRDVLRQVGKPSDRALHGGGVQPGGSRVF